MQDVGTVRLHDLGGVAFHTCCPNHWIICTAKEARQFAKALKQCAKRSDEIRGDR